MTSLSKSCDRYATFNDVDVGKTNERLRESVEENPTISIRRKSFKLGIS